MVYHFAHEKSMKSKFLSERTFPETSESRKKLFSENSGRARQEDRMLKFQKRKGEN